MNAAVCATRLRKAGAPGGHHRLLAVLFAAAACTAAAVGAPPASQAERTALEQVALARARTTLLAQVNPLPLGSGTVGDWLREDADLDRAVRLWARNCSRHGRFRWYSDGVCEADVRVTGEELREALRPLIGQYSGAAERRGVDEARLDAAARAWPVLWASGTSGREGPLRSANPAGWEDVTRDGVELARAAATADATYALLDELGRLKVSNARRLRDFLDSSEAVRNTVLSGLPRAATVRVRFEPDQVAVAEASITMRSLLVILTDACERHPEASDYQAADFREMALLAERETVSARGLAAPPREEALRSRYRLIEYDAPEWAATLARVTGRADVTLADAADEVRIEAARLDGIDRLRRAIDALELRPGVTIRSVLGYHADLKDDVAVLLAGARVTSGALRMPDGSLEVRVELPLRRLWEVMRRVMEVEEVDPPDAAPETVSAGAAAP